MANPFRRTRLWVDSGFQGRLLARMTGYLLLYAVVAFHLAFFFEVVLKSISKGGPANGFGVLYVDFLRQQKTLLLTLVLTAPYFLYNLLRFSNRIAGPLYRCRRFMTEMAEGKVVPAFKPRKHDLMAEFFQAFNALIKTCNERAAVAPSASLREKKTDESVANPSDTEAEVRIRSEKVPV